MRDTPEVLGHSKCASADECSPCRNIPVVDDVGACAGLSGKLQADLALMSPSIMPEDDHSELALLLLAGLTGIVKSESHARPALGVMFHPGKGASGCIG